jgi:FkbM family methyltransferase
MGIREGLEVYYSSLGVRGVLAMTSYRLFGRPREITAHAPGIRNPIHIRMRSTDAGVYRGILVRGEYAFDLPFSPKVIVDAGANVGIASIYFTHRYPDAKVIAVEPEASNFAALVKNVQPYPAIIPVQAALWNRDGEISIGEPDPSCGRVGAVAFFTHEGEGSKVRAITMRTLMKEMQVQSVDLLKVDIEGAEKEVFENCDWIDDVRCMMVELHDRFKPGCSEALNSVTSRFSKIHRVETTLYLRDS